jgi:hypothetical protein
MTETAIIENLRARLAMPVGRHLYGVLGTYPALDAFAQTLAQARLPDGAPFPRPLAVNAGILNAIPDDEFRDLARDEAKRPEPVRAHVARAFETFLRTVLARDGLVVLAQLELLFAYGVELAPLRTLAADDRRVVLLLPGRRSGERVIMYPEADTGGYTLPTNLIANDHLWEL